MILMFINVQCPLKIKESINIINVFIYLHIQGKLGLRQFVTEKKFY